MAQTRPETAAEKPPPAYDNTEELKAYVSQKLSAIEDELTSTIWDMRQQIDNHTYQIVNNAAAVLKNNINTMFGELYSLKQQVESKAYYATNQLNYTEGKLSGEHNNIITAIDNIDVQLDDVGSAITSDLKQGLIEATDGITNLLDESRTVLSSQIRDTTNQVMRVTNEQTDYISARIVHAQESADERAKRLNNIVVTGIETTGKHISDSLTETEHMLAEDIGRVQSTVEQTPELLIMGLSFLWEQMESFLSSNFDLSFEGMVKLIKNQSMAQDEAAKQLIKERWGA